MADEAESVKRSLTEQNKATLKGVGVVRQSLCLVWRGSGRRLCTDVTAQGHQGATMVNKGQD